MVLCILQITLTIHLAILEPFAPSCLTIHLAILEPFAPSCPTIFPVMPNLVMASAPILFLNVQDKHGFTGKVRISCRKICRISTVFGGR